VVASGQVGAESDGPGSGVGVRQLACPESGKPGDVVGADVFSRGFETVDVAGSDGM